MAIYRLTSNKIEHNVLLLIDQISDSYNGDERILFEKWYTVIYACMVAEENKDFAMLKKRIKRLGMYQLLIDKYSVSAAVNFSKGKKWKELDKIMKEKGF